jgi:hypothetical protein
MGIGVTLFHYVTDNTFWTYVQISTAKQLKARLSTLSS